MPGIGPYTAGAVACFAFGRAVPVVDTNVARVLCRYFVVSVPPAKAELWTLAANEVPDENANSRQASAIAYHNAMMDIGATICTAKTAHCQQCPLAQGCAAYADEARHRTTGNPLKVATAKHHYGTAVRGSMPIVLGLIHDDAGKYLVTRRPVTACRWLLGTTRRQTRKRAKLTARLWAEKLPRKPVYNYYQRDLFARFIIVIPIAPSDSVFRCRVYHPQQAQALAADDLRWVTPEEFLRLEFPHANSPIQQRLAAYHKITTADS